TAAPAQVFVERVLKPLSFRREGGRRIMLRGLAPFLECGALRRLVVRVFRRRGQRKKVAETAALQKRSQAPHGWPVTVQGWQACWRATDQAALPFKGRLPRLEGTNSCTHFPLCRGQNLGEDDTVPCTNCWPLRRGKPLQKIAHRAGEKRGRGHYSGRI